MNFRDYFISEETLQEMEQSIEAFAKASGKTEDEVKKIWGQAAGKAKSEGKASNFAYIAGMVKGMLKIKD